jgi:plastocyanin
MSWRIPVAMAMTSACPSSTAEVHEVTVQNFNFSPNDLTIQAGDTVRWTNMDGFHDVTEDSFSWASETGFDWVYEREFGQPGVVLYHCSVHSGPGQPIQTSMNGRISVEAPAEQPLFADGFE